MLRPTVQSASLAWNKAPIWGLRPDLYYCQTVAGLLVCGALSDRGRVCRLPDSVSNNKSLVSMYNLHLQVIKCIVAYLRHTRIITSKHAPRLRYRRRSGVFSVPCRAEPKRAEESRTNPAVNELPGNRCKHLG
jgi:hypothetical protein